MNFPKIRFYQINRFLAAYSFLTVKKKERIMHAFSDTPEIFEIVISFLENIGLLKQESNQIKIILKRDDYSDETKAKDIIAKHFLRQRHSYSRQLRSFLGKFVHKKEIVECIFSNEDKIKFSNIRNLLADLEIIIYDHQLDKYYLNNDYVDFSMYHNPYPFSPQELQNKLKHQTNIGKMAELIVIDYEKKRLSDFINIIPPIRHIAENDVTSGYDILSFTILDKDEVCYKPRYIEVKTFSKKNKEFYLSKKEYDFALDLNTNYYLYLVPNNGKSSFYCDQIEIINNPIKCDSFLSHWKIESDSYFIKAIENEY